MFRFFSARIRLRYMESFTAEHADVSLTFCVLTCQVTQIGSDHVFFHVEAHITFRCDIKQLPGPSAICPEDAGVTCLHFEHVVLLVSPGFILCIYIYIYTQTYTYRVHYICIYIYIILYIYIYIHIEFK